MTVDRSEGDTNLSPQRRAWSARHVSAETRRWLEADARYFLHQALSTPCLDVIVKADGLWLEALEHVGVVPDIMVLGKALGGGVVPIAALLTRGDLDVIPDRALGHYTHEKNPFTCAAALETLAIVEDERLAYFLERLRALRDRHPLVGDVRGQGLLAGVELVTDRESKRPAESAADHVLYAALERGLSFKTTMGNVLTLTPPLTVTRADIDRAVGILDESLAEAEAQAAR